MSKKAVGVSLSSKTVDELKKDLFELKRALFNLRFRVAAKDIVDVSQFKKNRRAVAKIKTEMNIREGGANA